MPNVVDQMTNDTTASPAPNQGTAPVAPSSDTSAQVTQTEPSKTLPTDDKSVQQGEGNSDASQIDTLLDDKGQEPKEGDEPKDGEEKKDGEKPSQLGAPEDGYKFEGVNPVGPAIEAFTNAAKELDLSQDSANLVLSKSLEGIKSQMAHQRNELVKQCMQDEALGLRDASSRSEIQKTYARYFGDKPELRAKLKSLNLDVDPQFLGVLKKISGEMSEGSFVNGQRDAGGRSDDFRSLYPNTRMNR